MSDTDHLRLSFHPQQPGNGSRTHDQVWRVRSMGSHTVLRGRVDQAWEWRRVAVQRVPVCGGFGLGFRSECSLGWSHDA